jgi:hypothetical protein
MGRDLFLRSSSSEDRAARSATVTWSQAPRPGSRSGSGREAYRRAVVGGTIPFIRR